jgi:hypothetical protein
MIATTDDPCPHHHHQVSFLSIPANSIRRALRIADGDADIITIAFVCPSPHLRLVDSTIFRPNDLAGEATKIFIPGSLDGDLGCGKLRCWLLVAETANLNLRSLGT